MAHIEARGLTKAYNGVRAVDHLDLAVETGEIFGFLGPNGSGKTSTIKMLLGLSRPDSGTARIGGKPVDMTHREFRRKIGYLPERIAFYPNLTATQTLEFFAELKGGDKKQIPGLLKDVGLAEHGKKRVGQYSKGMRQMLGVAQALLGKPSLLLFDEPMEGLDPHWRREVKDVLVRARARGATVFFSSHILVEVEEVADRVAILNRGKLVALDTVAALRGKLGVNPRLRLRVAGDMNAAGAVAARLPGVTAAQSIGEELVVQCEPVAKARVIAALVQAGHEILDFRSDDPTLEEVFLQYTGKGAAL